MKLQIIETPDYILWVSDKGPETGDWFLHKTNADCSLHKCIDRPQKQNVIGNDNIDYFLGNCKKVIAHQPKGNAPELDLPLLPEMVVEDDVEKLLKTRLQEIIKNSVENGKNDFLTGQSAGFAESIQIYRRNKAATKGYSEEDLREAIEYAYNKGVLEIDISIDEIISQSLKQPKTPLWFVAETVCDQCLDDETVDSCYCNFGNYKTELKTTTINGKTYLVGTYLYE
jgi:hypothetical protein